MKHQDYVEMVPFYVAQSLTPTEKRDFEAYLQTHPELKTDLAMWRKIATATWQEGQAVSSRTASFPQHTVDQWQPPANLPSEAVPDYAQAPRGATASKPLQRSNSVLTLVAGFLAVVVFGGLALIMLNRNQNEALTAEALNATEPMVAGAMIFEVSPTVAIDQPPATVTATPDRVDVATATVFSPRTSPTPRLSVLDPSVIPQTYTPTPFDPSVPNCLISTAQGQANIYAFASRNANVVAVMAQGATKVTYVQDANGWIQYYEYNPQNNSYLLGWINPSDVELLGSCNLWVATATAQVYFDGTFTPTPNPLEPSVTPTPSQPTFTPTPGLSLTPQILPT